MALTNCHECQREISDTAPACPHCGAPKPAPSTQESPTTDVTPPPAEKPKGAGKYVLIVLLLAGLVVGFPLYMGQQARADKTLIGTAQDHLRGQMKDPGSAEFSDVRIYRVPKAYGEDISVCGTVNARNGFGAYAGKTRFVVTGIFDNADFRIFSSQVEAQIPERIRAEVFNSMQWGKYCSPAPATPAPPKP